ncbi:hypothetical protein B0H13DRAFT_2285655 [Mycena leptocephala]|nr:hypothetical protein B0H13DRAFT_2285655 [Mycena leptocephala]
MWEGRHIMTVRREHEYDWVSESAPGAARTMECESCGELHAPSHVLILSKDGVCTGSTDCRSLRRSRSDNVTPSTSALFYPLAVPATPAPAITTSAPETRLVLPNALRIAEPAHGVHKPAVSTPNAWRTQMHAYAMARIPPSGSDRGGHGRHIASPPPTSSLARACSGHSDSTLRAPVVFARSRIVGYCQCIICCIGYIRFRVAGCSKKSRNWFVE